MFQLEAWNPATYYHYPTCPVVLNIWRSEVDVSVLTLYAHHTGVKSHSCAHVRVRMRVLASHIKENIHTPNTGAVSRHCTPKQLFDLPLCSSTDSTSSSRSIYCDYNTNTGYLQVHLDLHKSQLKQSVFIKLVNHCV